MADTVNIQIDQGATFNLSMLLQDQEGEDIDVTGMTATSKVRKHPGSNTAYTVTTTLANGSITLAMNAAATANMSHGQYVYDVLLTDSSNNVTRIVEGMFHVRAGVTR